ncbi:hypothetical protein MJO28_002930 [Puccinia striiformis f. sp. tritici]|uniref:Uncharacterized protein n=1 Tax=Puccinia striiformis f. sp. tritici TaxID=168172 RepID=A0ACC0ES24_9BASI|nr:hypothetical protein MJO28_002930 [Puccinia striiformis f. sp. tritici]
MVNTRKSKAVLQGPLPPTTRAKRPKQTKAYKALLALPPLPPSPTEQTIEVPEPSTSYGKLLPTPFRPQDDHARRSSTSPESSKSSNTTTPSEENQPPNSPTIPLPKGPDPIDHLLGVIHNLELEQPAQSSAIPPKLYSLTSTPDFSPDPIFERPPSPFLSKLSHIFSEFLGRHPILTTNTPSMSTPINTSEPTPKSKFLQQPSLYKSDVDPLLADGSNFNKWQRGLTRVIHLTLGHANFFDKAENYTKLSAQEQTCLLFLIQITVHDELSSIVDRFNTGTEAYDAVQTNFQGSVRFRQIELMDKLLEFKITGPTTKPNQLAGLFNRVFEIFADLNKVGAGLPPVAESLVLQAICPTPPSMSRSQFFQNIALQLGAKKDITARDIQTIVNSAYGESIRFDSTTSSDVSVFRTWHNQPNNQSAPWGQNTSQGSWNSSRANPIRPPQRNPFQGQPRAGQPNGTNHRQQNIGRPGHPTVDDIAAAINNIRKGNQGPNDPNLFTNCPCLYCEVPGHWRSSCPTLRRDANLPAPGQPTNGRPASGFARQAAPPNGPPTGLEQQAAARSAVGADATGAAGAGTVLDSGATHHVSGSFHLFSSLLSLNPPMKLNLASSDGSMLATHSGHLRMTNGAGTLTIPKVLYSPEMTGTLLSLGQFIDAGFKPSFLPNNDIRLTSSFGSITAHYNRRSWTVNPNSFDLTSPSIKAITRSSNQASLSPSYEWHCRLGHVSDNIVKDFLKRFVPTFDIKSWTPFICESCKKSKSEQRRQSLPEIIPREDRLDLLVTDVMGPFDQDINGNRFLLTVRDHATTYSFVFPMKSRSEVPSIIIALVKRLVLHFKTGPKFIRCDNAKEYTVKPLTDYLDSIGCQIIFTSPYTPEQNGEAERLNRTLGDIARTTLAHSELPSKLWSYAYRCACYLVNRLSNQRCKTSPLELWSGRQPLADTFYPFGSRASVHVPKERRKKLNQRGWTGYLIGYQDDERGWYFWNPSTQKTVNSECASFMDFQGKPIIPSPSSLANNPTVRRVLTLGQEKTKEICEEQDAQIDHLQAISDAEIPTTLKNALRSPAAGAWRDACISEWTQLTDIETFEIEEKDGKHSIGTRFVFDIKRDVNGEIEKFKARFVVRGFKQRLGIDVRSTFAPTASLSTLRALLVLALRNRWIINSFDITGAFVHSPIEETIYVDPPVELFPHLSGKVLRLKKALYGTRQASRCWWKHFKSLLHGWGFECDEVEECLYRYKKGDSVIIVWIHVDDGIVFGNNQNDLNTLRTNMENSLRVKWDTEPKKLVGLRLDYEGDSIFLSQHLLLDQTVEKFKTEVNSNLVPTYTPLAGDNLVTSWGEPVSPTLYQSLIGSINYLALGTRPDLSFAVNYLARFSSNPNETHWAALSHLVQYIHTTRSKRLRLRPTGDDLVTWVDANWGGEFQRSTSGFIITLMGSPIAWGSRRQKVVATSTCAAEFISLGSSVDFLLFLIPILKSLEVSANLSIKCDNRAAVLVSDDNASKGRMKSLERNFFFVNDAVREHQINLNWVSTASNIADFFTKPLRANLHSISMNKIFT